ncbi:MAG: WD40 repeat domain-containing protein [Nitrospirota bacterium]
MLIFSGRVGSSIASIAFYSAGRKDIFYYVAAGSNDGMIKIWDGVSGQELKAFKGHSRSVASLVFSHGIFTTLGTYILSYNNEEKLLRYGM